MTSEDAVKTITRIRLPIGLGAWLTPVLASKLFGLDAANNPQSPYLARLFGARDVALAAGVLQSTGEARRTWLRIGLACDVADAAAGIIGGREGYLSPFASALVTAPALVGVALGARALQGA
jgi:hypothetical protein